MSSTKGSEHKKNRTSTAVLSSLIVFCLPIFFLYSVPNASWSNLVSLLPLGHVDVPVELLLRWSNSTALSNEFCVVEKQADACEDIKIHFSSGTAFVACGNPEARTKWYPPSGRHDASARPANTWQEKIFKYDIGNKKTTELELVGLNGDFISHGLDILDVSIGDNSSEHIHIYAVNHARNGDSISIFSHKIGEDSAQLVKDVKHPGIKNANGVAAIGPLSFYITNDHYFTSKSGWLRSFEEKFGPWSWATHVQYCDASGPETVCRQVSGTFPGANGLLRSSDDLFVGDCRTAEARIFKILPDMTLQVQKTVKLGGAADNINVIPTTGDVVVTLFPNVEDLPAYLANVHELGKTKRIPSCAVRLVRSKGFEPELFYYDDGSILSYMTVTAVDPYRNVLIGGSVLQYGGFAVCELPKTSFS